MIFYHFENEVISIPETKGMTSITHGDWIPIVASPSQAQEMQKSPAIKLVMHPIKIYMTPIKISRYNEQRITKANK